MRKRTVLLALVLLCTFVFVPSQVSYAGNLDNVEKDGYTFVFDDGDLCKVLFGTSELTDVNMLLDIDTSGGSIAVDVLYPGTDSNGSIWYMDENGEVSSPSYDNLQVVSFAYDGSLEDFFVENSKICRFSDEQYVLLDGHMYAAKPDGSAKTAESGTFAEYQGTLYHVTDSDGSCVIFEGIYEDCYYVDGSLYHPDSDTYVMLDGRFIFVTTDGEVTIPAEGEYISYDNQLYQIVDPDGEAVLFTGVYDAYYYLDGTICETEDVQYVVYENIMYKKEADGKAGPAAYGKNKVCMDGKRYEVVDNSGTARAVNGIYMNYYYIDGLKYQTDGNTHMIVDQCMYTKYPSGYIKLTAEGLKVLCDGVRYVVGAYGYPTPFTGVYNNYLYENGYKVKTENDEYRFVDYVMYNKAPSGKLSYPKKNSYVMCDGILYYVEDKIGSAYEFSGIYKSYLYEEGKAVKSSAGRYIIYDGQAYYRSKEGKMTLTEKGQYFKMDGRLYLVEDEYGDAYAFSGIHKKKYYQKGQISVQKSTYVTYKNKLYYIDAAGMAATYTGMYINQYYRKGVKKSYYGTCNGKVIQNGKYYKPKKKTKMVIGGRLHMVSRDGSYKIYKKKFGKKYTDRCLNIDGKYYIFKIYPKTAKANPYKRNKNKSGTYQKVLKKRVYKVSYKTGKADLFTGVYKHKYYKKSKRAYFKKTSYVIYNGYIYKVKKNGSSKVFHKSKKKKGTYIKRIGGDKFYIYYESGRVKYGYAANPSRQKLIQTAMKYLGISDRNNGHKCILNIYNSQKTLPRGYAIKTWDPWCATFASAMAIRAKFTNIIKPEVSCYYQMLSFMSMGRWRENENYTPKPGDFIYYDWQDNGKGDNMGHPDHVGIVEKVAGGYITVIEGNHNGRVARRVIKVNGRYIRGYGLPAFKSE